MKQEKVLLKIKRLEGELSAANPKRAAYLTGEIVRLKSAIR